MAKRPLLIRAVNAADRTVGGRLAAIGDSREFVTAMTTVMRIERRAEAAFERRTRSFLHFWNLPAHTEIKRLSRQVATLSQEVRTLRAELEDERQSTDDRPGGRETGRV